METLLISLNSKKEKGGGGGVTLNDTNAKTLYELTKNEEEMEACSTLLKGEKCKNEEERNKEGKEKQR